MNLLKKPPKPLNACGPLSSGKVGTVERLQINNILSVADNVLDKQFGGVCFGLFVSLSKTKVSC